MAGCTSASASKTRSSRKRSPGTVASTILYANAGVGGAQGAANQVQGATVTYSCVQGGFAGTGNISVAPLFVDAGAGDYRQAPGSPTVDAGTTDPDLGTTDLDGDARTLGSAPDIGADELVPAVTPPPPGDTTPPETTISKGPRAKTTSKKATFRFAASESGSTFVCALDGNVARPCVSPLKLTRVTKGKHKLTVVATDAAGNADATPASYRWKVKKKRKKR